MTYDYESIIPEPTTTTASPASHESARRHAGMMTVMAKERSVWTLVVFGVLSATALLAVSDLTTTTTKNSSSRNTLKLMELDILGNSKKGGGDDDAVVPVSERTVEDFTFVDLFGVPCDDAFQAMSSPEGIGHFVDNDMVQYTSTPEPHLTKFNFAHETTSYFEALPESRQIDTTFVSGGGFGIFSIFRAHFDFVDLPLPAASSTLADARPVGPTLISGGSGCRVYRTTWIIVNKKATDMFTQDKVIDMLTNEMTNLKTNMEKAFR